VGDDFVFQGFFMNFDLITDAQLLSSLCCVTPQQAQAALDVTELNDLFFGAPEKLVSNPSMVATMRTIQRRIACFKQLHQRSCCARLRIKPILDQVATVQDYLRTLFSGLDAENFQVLFFDTKSRLIHSETMFQGSLNTNHVFPREVVKAALKYSAAAILIAHNHPSGDVTPSAADKAITQCLRAALALIDVRVIDHYIIGRESMYSMLEHGF
jgi:DNA repair protein RadC